MIRDDTALTMIPGPTPVHPRILEALAAPTTSHQDPGFVERFRACLANLKAAVFAESAQPFIVSGSGTLAMEMALVNLVGEGEKLLILSQGFFGDRWAQLAEAFDRPFELVQAGWGRAVLPDELESRLGSGDYAAVAMTHVDTSTGAAAPVKDYCEILRDRPELILVDGVCATGGMEERFDDWGIDLLLTGAQKALGTPPGLAILLASPRALQKRKSLERVPAFTADLLRWQPIMDNPANYFSTPPVNEIRAFGVALEIVLEESLPSRFERHARIAGAFRAAFEAAGLELFTSGRCLADTLSVIRYPEGIGDEAFRCAMASRNVAVAGALGPIRGQAFRVGHMGNIGAGEVLTTVSALESSLVELGREGIRGRALAAASELL